MGACRAYKLWSGVVYCGRTKVRRTLYVAPVNRDKPLFPRRLLHQVLRLEHYSSIILFQGINSSASQAT